MPSFPRAQGSKNLEDRQNRRHAIGWTRQSPTRRRPTMRSTDANQHVLTLRTKHHLRRCDTERMPRTTAGCVRTRTSPHSPGASERLPLPPPETALAVGDTHRASCPPLQNTPNPPALTLFPHSTIGMCSQTRVRSLCQFGTFLYVMRLVTSNMMIAHCPWMLRSSERINNSKDEGNFAGEGEREGEGEGVGSGPTVAPQQYGVQYVQHGATPDRSVL